MSEDGVALDDLLQDQERLSMTATLEPVVGDDASVRVTPYAPQAGCSCDYSLTVPRSSISNIQKSNRTHVCCGKPLHVVTVDFDHDAYRSAFRQLASKANTLSPGRETRATWSPLGTSTRFTSTMSIEEFQAERERLQAQIDAMEAQGANAYDLCMARNDLGSFVASYFGYHFNPRYCIPEPI